MGVSGNAVAGKPAYWIEVGTLNDIPPLGARVVRTARGDIALFRTANDEVFALNDKCPHKGGPLSQGIVHGKRVTCPLHNWVVELTNGSAVAPDEGRTACYPVKVERGVISISLCRDELQESA
ncbi:MAG: nitrite reductase small subunit NirD [Gammaproteobacteria bacterium]|nr:nitrite reductase small subunit NirD [Gammaproteobacteria bacterium]